MGRGESRTDIIARAQIDTGAIDQTNPIPYNTINFTNNVAEVDSTNIAQAGTLTLEFCTLSKHTGNNTYCDLALKSAKAVINTPAPLPGLPAQVIDPATAQPEDGYVVCLNKFANPSAIVDLNR